VFASDGKRILTASVDLTALWDGDGKLIASLGGHQGVVLSAVFAPDGKRILTASPTTTRRGCGTATAGRSPPWRATAARS